MGKIDRLLREQAALGSMQDPYQGDMTQYDPELEEKYIRKVEQMQAFYNARRDSFSGRYGSIGPRSVDSVRIDNNRPAARNTITVWPEGGPKPIRRRGSANTYDYDLGEWFYGKKGKF